MVYQIDILAKGYQKMINKITKIIVEHENTI